MMYLLLSSLVRINHRFGKRGKVTFFLMLALFITTLNISFSKVETNPNSVHESGKRSIQIKNYLDRKLLLPGENLNSFHFETTNFRLSISSVKLTTALPFFPLVFIGNGVDHMSINLVNLSSTGLLVGDEIGIFDSIYCVGSAVISENHLLNNNLSIPASSNETNPGSPNGYIEGHPITLKLYRSGNIYTLYFELVNNSRNIFEKWGSMFAFVDFSKSTGLYEPTFPGFINIYPIPFSESINIEISLIRKQNLKCEILDISGKLVRTLFHGEAHQKLDLIWNATDNQDKKVPSGIYFFRINDKTTKIIYKSISGQF